MNRHSCVSILLLMFLASPAYALPEAANDGQKTAQAATPLDQLAKQVQNLLVKEKIQHRFDLLRRLQAQGLTWQPTAITPNDLVNNLNPQQLRFYAGVKLFDTLYAATFMQKKAVSEQLATLEAINNKLDLRSYADLSGKLLATLNKALAAPESPNLQALIEQLAADYAGDIPALMSSQQGADYLLDSLYGFTVETGSLLGNFHRLDPKGEGNLMKSLRLPENGITEWMQTLVALFEAYGRANETISVNGKSVEKLAFIREVLDGHYKHRKDPGYKPADRGAVFVQAAAIRSAMLESSTAVPGLAVKHD